MEYRKVGKTGKRAGVIGLGCEHLTDKPYEQVRDTVHAAVDCGINLFDVFMPGREVRENIAKALGNRRKDVMIQGHIGSTDVNRQFDISRDMPSVRRYFEDMLRIFGGYIDFGMLFFIDSEEDYKGVFETDFVEYALQLKREGKIGHIGFSSHNPVMAMRAIETGVPEMLMFSINAAFDLYPAEVNALDQWEQSSQSAAAFHGIDPIRAKLYKMCEQRGIGITVMKTLGAGKLISPEHTPFEKPMTVPQCIHYALTRPATASVLLGCKTGDEVRRNMEYLQASEHERDYSAVLGTLRNDFRGNCVYCSHCQPCPMKIDIAAVNKYLDIARLDEANIPPSVRSHYQDLAFGGDLCIGCGSCERRCPFGVKIIENMVSAAKLLG